MCLLCSGYCGMLGSPFPFQSGRTQPGCYWNWILWQVHLIYYDHTYNLTITVWPFSFDLLSCRSRDINFVPEVTALQYKNALNLAVGTSSGQILLFDLRSPRPYYVKDHYYDSPIQSVLFHKLDGLVLSADKKIVKIWHEHDVRLLMILVCLVNIWN